MLKVSFRFFQSSSWFPPCVRLVAASKFYLNSGGNNGITLYGSIYRAGINQGIFSWRQDDKVGRGRTERQLSYGKKLDEKAICESWQARRLGVDPGIIPHRGCSVIFARQGHAFAPEVITTLSTLLRMTPPLCLASVLLLSRVRRLSVSLGIETTGSQVPYPRLQEGRATSMPDAVKPTFRLPFD